MSKKSRNTADQIYMKTIAISTKINNLKNFNLGNVQVS
jgi:hypothetical protein